MINLFEKLDKKTIKLLNTLRNVGMNHQTILLEDNGFLPENTQSPYSFFSKCELLNVNPLFFNEVPVPDLWEIEGNNSIARIRDKGRVRGKIKFKKNWGTRIVEHVEWLNEKGQTQYIDYYNKYGYKFAQLLLDDNGKYIVKKYYNDKGKIIISENFVTNSYILTWRDKEYFFNSKLRFLEFYLEQSKIKLDSFLINSLAFPYALLRHVKNIEGKDYLFWQESPEELPGNMKYLLNNGNRTANILIPNSNEYNRIYNWLDDNEKNYLFKVGYVYDFIKQNSYSNEILTLTNSDDIPNIEQIVSKNPHLHFNIVAVTEMSKKLMSLGVYKNVSLYPHVRRSKVTELYKQCDIYLDINHGSEILDSVHAAFDYNLLILGYNETCHNNDVVDLNNLFKIENYEKLIEILASLPNKIILDNLLDNQLVHGRSISKDEFKSFFSK
ncbi:accessory Sec system glycosylation chaperone GtfB [Staphylococcus pragensis]|uniref:UDP-N-acetylglucosamine--peptide N-acetylglucosaminyltransferase stabilizing protein GtfB n=1 Tax=Staphylococcus pragensis TaxID=1611836 RepID=A0A4Z1BGB0_9STAP|nr:MULTISPECIES: accessory Sec system glycosylation chaperone GtfB [Staphylococcus]RTX91265.1 accessory Sec system glycosylation chaperone GtfB [Staphylococcus carnosus]TGN24460.1 accessory Sec system glycosylation chaperone GtfB [Staphylococcus pragensis]GGG98755.1 glycosyltransferase stabilizing protein Gtf2 [Staphylococcus pragensis]